MNLKKIFITILTIVLLRHCYYLIQTFVDIPYRDSWQLITSDSFSWPWLIRPHNEHFIILSKLLVWFLYEIDNWNVVINLSINYLLYLLTFACICLLFKRQAIAPIIFGLCSLNWENLSWEFQSCFHFFLLFLLLTIYFLEKKKLIVASLCNLLMVLSLSTGLAASITLAIYSTKINKKLWILFILPCLIYVFKDKSTAAIVYDLRFADFFLNLISFGFGFETYSWILGMFCLICILIPIRYKDKNFNSATALVLSTLASLAIIAFGRAGNTDLHIWSKGARYYEIAFLLVPAGYVLWLSYLREKKLEKFAYLFLILPLIGTANNWDYSLYKWIAEQKQIGRECMRNSSSEKFYCKTLWAEESSNKKKLAEEFKLSFLE